MTNKTVQPPPPSLLDPAAASPRAQTLVSELRTDASLDFDPKAAPGSLKIIASGFGAMILWTVDLSWSDAQKVQIWLSSPAAGTAALRQDQFKLFIDNLTAPNGDDFLTYVGTYVESGVSHASYTVVLGMKSPMPLSDYKVAFLQALSKANPPAWHAQILEFLKLILNQPTSREQYLLLASAEDSFANAPLIGQLIT